MPVSPDSCRFLLAVVITSHWNTFTRPSSNSLEDDFVQSNWPLSLSRDTPNTFTHARQPHRHQRYGNVIKQILINDLWTVSNAQMEHFKALREWFIMVLVRPICDISPRKPVAFGIHHPHHSNSSQHFSTQFPIHRLRSAALFLLLLNQIHVRFATNRDLIYKRNTISIRQVGDRYYSATTTKSPSLSSVLFFLIFLSFGCSVCVCVCSGSFFSFEFLYCSSIRCCVDWCWCVTTLFHIRIISRRNRSRMFTEISKLLLSVRCARSELIENEREREKSPSDMHHMHNSYSGKCIESSSAKIPKSIILFKTWTIFNLFNFCVDEAAAAFAAQTTIAPASTAPYKIELVYVFVEREAKNKMKRLQVFQRSKRANRTLPWSRRWSFSQNSFRRGRNHSPVMFD